MLILQKWNLFQNRIIITFLYQVTDLPTFKTIIYIPNLFIQ